MKQYGLPGDHKHGLHRRLQLKQGHINMTAETYINYHQSHATHLVFTGKIIIPTKELHIWMCPFNIPINLLC